MSWRVVITSKRCKLEYQLGYMICRGEETKKVFLDEVSTLIVENPAVAVTGVLLAELVKRKINVIFCDERHNPLSQLNGLYGRYDSSGRIKEQLRWSDEIKSSVWAEIVKEKINQQSLHLEDMGLNQSELLKEYIDQVQLGDSTNREGHAAKVYFNALFGLNFKRNDAENFFNGLMNYGYAIILSAFNREIVSAGYLTQCGLFHKNEFNHFNLSCDLMEPFRVLVDRRVIALGDKEFDLESKHSLADILNDRVTIGGCSATVSDAIGIYCNSVFSALNECDLKKIKYYELGV